MTGASCFRYAPAEADLHPFVLQFGQEKDLKAIEAYFRKFALDNFKFTVLSKGSLKDVLLKLSQLDWNLEDLYFLGDMGITSMEVEAAEDSVAPAVPTKAMIDAVQHLLNNNEEAIYKNRHAPLVAALKELGRHFLVRAVQLNQAYRLADFLITEPLLSAAIAEFTDNRVQSPGLVVNKELAGVLASELAAYNAQLLADFINLLRFQAAPFQIFYHYLHEVTGLIATGKVPIDYRNEAITLATLTELVAICGILPAEDKDQYGFLSSFARSDVLSVCHRTRVKSISYADYYKEQREDAITNLFTSLYNNILAMFHRSHNIAVLNEAKKLYTDFFLPAGYHKPSTEYIRFLMVKYLEEGFKDKAAKKDAWLRRLREVYIVDLLHASSEYKKELMTELEIRKVLEAFLETTAILTRKNMAEFNDFRALMLQNSELLDRYEQFFSSFYNVGLYYVEFATWHDSSLQSRTEKFAVKFDTLLSECLKRTGAGIISSFLNGRLPDDSIYDMAMVENYPAYKILNMQAFPAHFMHKSIAFSAYTDVQDKNIEELLFENGKFIDIILTIKEMYLNNKALNFGAFSGLTINSNFWTRLREVSPELFKKATVSEVI